MKRIICVGLLLLAIRSFAFGKAPLLPASKQLKEAYSAWKKQPKSIIRQQALIRAFPTSKKIFLAVFYPDDFGQLYDGHEYFVALDKISYLMPAQVIQLCVKLGKTHPQGSDAISYLHESTTKVALAHPQLFASELAKLNNPERVELFRFLADEEGIGDDPDYENLTRLMSKNNFPSYAAELRNAKRWRLRQPNH